MCAARPSSGMKSFSYGYNRSDNRAIVQPCRASLLYQDINGSRSASYICDVKYTVCFPNTRGLDRTFYHWITKGLANGVCLGYKKPGNINDPICKAYHLIVKPSSYASKSARQCISYRPRRGKPPSVCWQLPGRFRTPRSIYAVAFYTATRVIYGTTGLAFSLRDHILPPGRPLCGSLIILKSGVMACEAMLLSASSVSR